LNTVSWYWAVPEIVVTAPQSSFVILGGNYYRPKDWKARLGRFAGVFVSILDGSAVLTGLRLRNFGMTDLHARVIVGLSH
jgi:hypothetical protein